MKFPYSIYEKINNKSNVCNYKDKSSTKEREPTKKREREKEYVKN